MLYVLRMTTHSVTLSAKTSGVDSSWQDVSARRISSVSIFVSCWLFFDCFELPSRQFEAKRGDGVLDYWSNEFAGNVILSA